MAEASPERRLLLVRRGETACDADGCFAGRADPPLTERGRSQAFAVGHALGRLVEPLLVSSPRTRARATLGIIAERLGRVPAVEDARFDDLDYGDWTGLPHSRVAEHWPTAYELWRRYPDQLSPPSGERVRHARDRVWAACRDFVGKSPVVLIVTHDVCIRMAVCALLDAPLASMHRIRIDLTSITEITFRDTEASLTRMNDVAHLCEGPSGRADGVTRESGEAG